MTMPDYTPHFAVVGGPAPHPAGDGRMGVCLVASKAIKSVDVLEELLERPPWDTYSLKPPEYKIAFNIVLDHKVHNNIYTVIWAESYPEAWQSLFSLWGNDIQPDNPPQAIPDFNIRKAIQ